MIDEIHNSEHYRTQEIENLVRKSTEQSIGISMEHLKTASIFELESVDAGSKIKYFGTHHVRNPEDPILKQIGHDLTLFFESKNPLNCGVVLESPRPFVQDPTRHLTKTGILAGGEAEYSFLKAKSKGIESYCFEPSLHDQIDHVTQVFAKENVFMLFVGRAIVNYSEERHGSLGFEDFLKPQLARFAKESGWDSFDVSYSNLSRIYQELTGREFLPEEKQKYIQLYDPKKDTNPINEVGREIHIYRDTAIVTATDRLLQTEKTDLFFVYGNGHALTQRVALQYILDN